MLERFILLWLVLLSVLAYFWPAGMLGGFDPFLLTKPVLPYLIAVTMFAIGAMLPRREVEQIPARWRVVLGGVGLQYLTMPLLAYTVAHLAGLQGNMLIGVVLVGCVPGAMASNVLTLTARGNTSYSVSLTTVATLLSPLLAPVMLSLLLASQKDVDRMVLLWSAVDLCWMVVLPVIAGHVAGRYVADKWTPVVKAVGSGIANLTILWIIAVVVAANRANLLEMNAPLLLALGSLNAGGYAAGYLGGCLMRLPEPMRRALTLEIGMQNAGLGATIATLLFRGANQENIALAPAMYTFGCMLSGVLLARAWAVSSLHREPHHAGNQTAKNARRKKRRRRRNAIAARND